MDWHEASKPATFGEMAAERAEQRDRCLRQATNGYDIERCR